MKVPPPVACLPALGLAALAVALGVAGLVDGTVPNPAADAVAPATTPQDSVEAAAGSRSGGTFR